MAKFIWVDTVGMFTYSLAECEDYVLLDAYLKIKESPRANGGVEIKRFEYYYLTVGGTINDNILMQINAHLRRMGQDALYFVNGHTTAYAEMRGQDKLVRRSAILTRLRELPQPQREDLVAKKRAEAAMLAERDPKLPSRAPVPEKGLSRSEIERRRAALAEAQKQEAGVGNLRNNPSMEQGAPDTVHMVTAQPDDSAYVPESTVQDSVVDLITRMDNLGADIASLKAMFQAIFRNVGEPPTTVDKTV